MKATCAMLGALAAIAAHATVTVSGVAFTQDADSHDVTVSYDLATSDGEPAFVSLDVLTNGVSVGATRVKNVSGDVSTSPADTASLVSPGTGKRITWKARADLPNVGLTDAAVRVTAIATNHFEGLYMVVDLARGKDSAYWPVQYTACKPDTNSPAFYATELWLRRVPAGTFTMGYDNGDSKADACEPAHSVTLTNDFYCAVVPTTRAQHALVKGAWPNGEDESKGRYPVSKVSYNGIRGQNWPNNNLTQSGQIVTLLRNRTGLRFDLPTEAQWEYACRAGYSGNTMNDGTAWKAEATVRDNLDVGYGPLGWGQANSGWRSDNNAEWQHPVAMLKPSAWDFYDFYGNVEEWCRDYYGATYYGDSPSENPPGASTGTQRVRRGGSYALNATALNSYTRRSLAPTTSTDVKTGYRLVVETDEGDATATAQGVQRGSGDSAASLLETRPAATLAGFRANRPYSIIDTATPLSFVLIVR